MKFEPGSLVACRGREWVVQPASDEDSLLLKPLGGVDAEITRIFPELEQVESAAFSLPDPEKCGDATASALLRDAIRLGLRSTTGPFRSFGHIAVEPRPYQLVPLLMAMKQDVIRLLIADDVGIGKTVEALLIAREMLDRGEIARIAVLAPPQLAEQWQKEMEEKFQIEAVLVLPGTVARLEHGLGAGTSLFEKYPFTVVSLDYIKSDRHRNEFARACPEFVIVDEAHACASASGAKGQKQRFELISTLARDAGRHMVLVTATPHSGKEDVFRSLLTFLNPAFADLPDDLAGAENEKARRKLAEYFVQRRRGDIRAYMNQATPFPVRRIQELTWQANPEWLELFTKALALARDNIRDDGPDWQKRISWWSSLALLRAVSSSPAAACQSLNARAIGLDQPEADLAGLDDLAGQAVFDLDSGSEAQDAMPGADTGSQGQRFRQLARLAEALKGEKDAKLRGLVPHLKKLLADGYSPVIFCRFIPTAAYLAEELSKALPKCAIEKVTGLMPPYEREERVLALAERENRILVCTDCLSEGINLQNSFNAVIHYDLSWNPTRHEQREGRVDRFGQPAPETRIITWYGSDNPMDGMVLDVLLRKHEAIRKSLGISVPVPLDSDKIMETLLRGLILRKHQAAQGRNLLLPGLEEFIEPEKKRVYAEWDRIREEKRSRTLFSQQTVKTGDVAEALLSANAACGSSQTVEQFAMRAWQLLGGVITEKAGAISASFDSQARAKLPGLGLPEPSQKLVFELPAKAGQTYISRMHPLIEKLAAWLGQNALDSEADQLLPRCGAMRTKGVSRRQTLLICRMRFQILTGENACLAEECTAYAFAGSPQNAEWLQDCASLMTLEPDGNIASEQAAGFVRKVADGISLLMPHLKKCQAEKAQELLAWHRKIRDAAKMRNVRYTVLPQGEPDILGIFVYLPAGGQA